MPGTRFQEQYSFSSFPWPLTSSGNPGVCGPRKKLSMRCFPLTDRRTPRYAVEDPLMILVDTETIRYRFINTLLVLIVSAVLIPCLKEVVLYDLLIIWLTLSNGLESGNLSMSKRFIYLDVWSSRFKVRVKTPVFKFSGNVSTTTRLN